MVQTPSQIKKKENAEKKKRIEKVLKLLPTHWIEVFIITYPEYKAKVGHLRNVKYRRSLDINVIEKMEQLALKIQPEETSKK